MTEPADLLPLPPLAALRRFWLIGLLLALVGLAAGYQVGTKRPVTYTAQASLAVGGQQLSSFQIPGFALAVQEIAANYARYVGLPQSQATFRTLLGAEASKVQSVSGSPISDSNIILVEVVATNRQVAIDASNAVAGELMTEANAPNTTNTAAVYLSQYQGISAQLYAAQTGEEAAKLRLARMTRNHATATKLAIQQNNVNKDATTVASLLVQQKTLEDEYTNALTGETTYSQVVSAQTAVITLVSRRATLERYGLAGLVVGAGAGLALAVFFDRLSVRRRRRRLRRYLAAEDAAARQRLAAEERQAVLDRRAAAVEESSAR
jgi:hypothetical protein